MAVWVWFLLVGLLLVNLPVLWWVYGAGKVTSRKVVCALVLILVASVWVSLLDQPRLPARAALTCGPVLLALGALVGLAGFSEYGRRQVPLFPRDWVTPGLVTTGVYGWVRHPQYLAGALLVVGWFFLAGAVYALVLLAPLAAVTVWVRAWLEERYILGPGFGDEYREYQRRVGMLLPRFRRRVGAPSKTDEQLLSPP